MKNLKISIAAFSLLLAMNAAAQTATPKVAERQAVQHQRISNGAKSGELTKPEERRLKMREHKINHDKKMAKADGKVTPGERAKLNKEQNRTSKAIYRQKHDAQVKK